MANGLGDTHNFGRRVERRGRRIYKPRTVFWEWLVLGLDSPVRLLLDEVAGADFLPRLRFFGDDLSREGSVEAVSLTPLRTRSEASRLALATALGRAIGLFSWLGVADLHWENLALGANAEGAPVFGPLDVEMILGDFALPTRTMLLPDADPEVSAFARHAAGARRALPYLGKPLTPQRTVAVVAGALDTLTRLNRHARAIAEAISSLPGTRRAPIRVMLRGTDEYARARTGPVWPPLLDAESEQMARGDVPYFFRLLGKPGIRYWADEALTVSKSLPTRGDVPGSEPLLSLARGLRSPSRERLLHQGLLVVAAAFDDGASRGTFEHDDLRLLLEARHLVLTTADGIELRAPRRLRGIVDSVYLPCSCGETRSVLVRAATVCVHASADRGTRTRRGTPLV